MELFKNSPYAIEVHTAMSELDNWDGKEGNLTFRTKQRGTLEEKFHLWKITGADDAEIFVTGIDNPGVPMNAFNRHSCDRFSTVKRSHEQFGIAAFKFLDTVKDI